MRSRSVVSAIFDEGGGRPKSCKLYTLLVVLVQVACTVQYRSFCGYSTSTCTVLRYKYSTSTVDCRNFRRCHKIFFVASIHGGHWDVQYLYEIRVRSLLQSSKVRVQYKNTLYSTVLYCNVLYCTSTAQILVLYRTHFCTVGVVGSWNLHRGPWKFDTLRCKI